MSTTMTMKVDIANLLALIAKAYGVPPHRSEDPELLKALETLGLVEHLTTEEEHT